MELADALVINKADGESLNLANQTLGHYKNAFKLMKQNSFWTPAVKTCSALNNERIEEIWQMVNDYQKAAHEKINAGISCFVEKRARQNSEWLDKLIHEMLELKLKQNMEVKNKLPQLQNEVLNNKTTPYDAAQQIIDLL
jgi:LAO/AO transport system kinase